MQWSLTRSEGQIYLGLGDDTLEMTQPIAAPT
jgi:hypothetical protein